MRVGTCFITTDYHFENYDSGTCLRETTGKKNYLLLGDSHSAMLWSALASELPNTNVMQASTAACVPSLAPSGDDDCRAMMADIFQRFLPTHHIDGVFLVARWEQGDLDSLTKLIQWTNRQRVPVIVFGPVPEYDMPLPRILAYSIAWNEPNLASQHFMANQQILDAEMQRMAATSWRVPYVSLYKVICGTGGCLEYADPAHKLPLMGDDNHLSTPGAFYVVRRLLMKGELH